MALEPAARGKQRLRVGSKRLNLDPALHAPGIEHTADLDGIVGQARLGAGDGIHGRSGDANAGVDQTAALAWATRRSTVGDICAPWLVQCSTRSNAMRSGSGAEATGL